MILNQLFEISHETNIRTFSSLINGLITVIREANDAAERYLTTDDNTHAALSLIKSRESTWYGKNHFQIVSTANALMHVSPSFRAIAKTTLSAYRSDSLENTELTKRNGFKTFMDNIPECIKKLGLTDKMIMINNLMTERSTILSNINIKQTSSKAPATTSTTPRDTSNMDAQHKTLETTINNVLSSLPKAHQHKARQMIQKSDNKIEALTRYLQMNNLN